jgi:uncharacterized protein YjbI with pentapeptide repeats
VPEELDARDKELLKNIDQFNQTYAASGWHIQDKDISQDLSRVLLAHSSLTSSRLLHVDLESARVFDTQFTGVEFQQAKFTSAVLESVVFTGCKFLMSSFENAKVLNCRFVNCEAKDLNAKHAAFEGCSFESFKDRSGAYDEATLGHCSFDECHLYNSSFFWLKIDSVAIHKSMLEYLVFSSIKGSNLLFEEDSFENCGFSDSRFGSLILRGGKHKGVTFKAFEASNVTIEKCASSDNLSILESKWTGVRIADCPTVSELTINHSRMQDLVIERNQMAYFEMKETTVVGRSRIADCTIDGMGLDNSRLVGLEMANCRLTRYLTLDGATFDAVVLSGITYAPALRFSAQNVAYLNGSAHFGR